MRYLGVVCGIRKWFGTFECTKFSVLARWKYLSLSGQPSEGERSKCFFPSPNRTNMLNRKDCKSVGVAAHALGLSLNEDYGNDT